jgi:hypothetical protein
VIFFLLRSHPERPRRLEWVIKSLNILRYERGGERERKGCKKNINHGVEFDD